MTEQEKRDIEIIDKISSEMAEERVNEIIRMVEIDGMDIYDAIQEIEITENEVLTAYENTPKSKEIG